MTIQSQFTEDKDGIDYMQPGDMGRIKFVVPEGFDLAFNGGAQTADQNQTMLQDISFEAVINGLAASRDRGDDVIVRFDQNNLGDVIVTVTNTDTQPLRYATVREQALALANDTQLTKYRTTSGRVGVKQGQLNAGETPITLSEFMGAIEEIHQSTTADAPRIQRLLSIPGFSAGKEESQSEGSGLGLAKIDQPLTNSAVAGRSASRRRVAVRIYMIQPSR